MHASRNLVLVLENIRSRLNVGAVFRSADAFGIAKIYLCGITPCPPHREIEKTALGATAYVDWEYRTQAGELIVELQAQGYQVLALEQHALSEPLRECRFYKEQNYALVLGNELSGISGECLDLADKIVEIVQYGQKKSLNIAVAAGVGLWAFQTQNT